MAGGRFLASLPADISRVTHCDPRMLYSRGGLCVVLTGWLTGLLLSPVNHIPPSAAHITKMDFRGKTRRESWAELLQHREGLRRIFLRQVLESVSYAEILPDPARAAADRTISKNRKRKKKNVKALR